MAPQLILPLEPVTRMAREDFIVAPANARVLAFLDAWPDWPAPAAVLWGPAASGKTHLAHIWAARAGALVMAARDLRAIPEGPVVVEECDCDAAGGHEAFLFAILERGAPLLLTGRRDPRTWPSRLPDLGSRFRALLALGLGEADEGLLMALAVKLFADRQLTVPQAAIIQLVRRLERSPAAIRNFIARADGEALSRHKPVNLQLIKELMAQERLSS
ncbi:MAG: chromosomal replication initiator DnaA [Rhizomicrobium sp.]